MLDAFPKKHFNGYTIYYDNQDSIEQLTDEIFKQEVYHFTSNKTHPVVIDAGANIGLATLYFKQCYPEATVICFEPDPIRFSLLKKNITVNHLKNIQLIQAALYSKTRPEIPFYGQIKKTGSDARGNSLCPEWGCQRPQFDVISVPSVQLSHYLNQPIDLLKLDVEGAEQAVLEEASGLLHCIKQIILEVHETQSLQQHNRVSTILSLLEPHFNVTTKLINTNNLFPHELEEWVAHEHPTLTIISATAASP